LALALAGAFYFMQKIIINTVCKKILADVYTPVGIYLRLRDSFRDSVLLESTDAHGAENSKSIIAINAIAGIEISDITKGEYKYPAQATEPLKISDKQKIPSVVQQYLQSYQPVQSEYTIANIAQGLYGYSSYEAVQFFDSINLDNKSEQKLPLIRYRLYQYVIIFDHFKDEIYLCENKVAGVESNFSEVENILRSRNLPLFTFNKVGEETTNSTNDAYVQMVEQGIKSCKRGDVFQIVLSRYFEQQFLGDDFNVYRSLRSINPGPYLFYFDYGDYRLMGSSPESQLLIEDGVATVHPIAGTFKRTGNVEEDAKLAEALQNDVKENAEHTMLVDLARNDLSRVCNNVHVTEYKKAKYYSHVIHLVSEVQGTLNENNTGFVTMAKLFPAGTLSGAPKFKAMQLINSIEANKREFYGGVIGYLGFNGNVNNAIMIRTFLSQNNTLQYRAGAGVVAASNPASELQEVNNKLSALKQAIAMAETINK
jgi:anthranilate synthase component I